MTSVIVNDTIESSIAGLETQSNAILNQIADLHFSNENQTTFYQLNSIGNKSVLSDLVIIQSSFTELQSFFNQKDLKNGKLMDLNKVNGILSTFKDLNKDNLNARSALSGNFSTEIKKEIDLIYQLKDLVLNYAVLSVYQIISYNLLDTTINISDDLLYWDSVLSSNMNIMVYLVQNFPANLFNLSKSIIADLKKLATISPVNAANNNNDDILVPDFLSSNFPNLVSSYKLFISYSKRVIDLLYKNLISNNIKIFNKLIGLNLKKSSLGGNLNFLRIVLGSPIYSVVDQIKNKRKNLLTLKNKNAEKLGFLILNLPNSKNVDENINNLYKSVNLELKQSEKESIQDDDNILKLYNFSNNLLPKHLKEINEIKSSNSIPSALTRYWPSALLLLLYGPSSVISIISNKEKIKLFIQNNLIETVKGFYKNWILKPLNNILSTIKHDDNSEISIMSQKSLNSDLNSLKRMVIDFTLENSEYRNLPSDELQSLKQQLDSLVSQGDLTPIMENYESEIKQPVKNLLKGNLIRSLLIQIQKTKVDGSIAISGIDKLLKSQELVFGIVAASPSFLIVFYLFSHMRNYLKNGVLFNRNNSTANKILISQKINKIENLINLAIYNKVDVNLFNGLVLIEMFYLKKIGLYLVPVSRRKEWLNDVNQLVDNTLPLKAKLNIIKRIHRVYNAYFI